MLDEKTRVGQVKVRVCYEKKSERVAMTMTLSLFREYTSPSL
jgi:hypothetical protein